MRKEHDMLGVFLSLALFVTEPARAQEAFSRLVPKPDLVLQWKDYSSTNPLSAFTKERIQPPACESGSDLYPTHPSQATKVYHVDKVGRYDVTKLRGNDPLCKRGQPANVSNPNGPSCFVAVEPRYVMMSDFYMDRCGNFYRAFWENGFTQSGKLDDHAYLLSKGRVVQMIGDDAAKESYTEGTYAVAPKDFTAFAPVSPAEMAIISREREKALKSGFRFDAKSFLFVK